MAGLWLLLAVLCALPAVAGPAASVGSRLTQSTSRSVASSNLQLAGIDHAYSTTRSVDDDGGLPAPTEERGSPAKKRRPQPQVKDGKDFPATHTPGYLLLVEAAGSQQSDPASRRWRDASLPLSASSDPALRLHRGRAPPLA